MAAPTQLETTIIKAAKKAYRSYNDLSGGEWLHHGPESFLQCEVARKIGKDGYWVYIDASNKKNAESMKPKRGRISKDSKRRFDISVWGKTQEQGFEKLKAVIEVKRTWRVEPLKKDADKIKSNFKSTACAKCGYILAYSTANTKPKLENNFYKWAKEIDAKITGKFIQYSEEEDMAWGVVLFRINKP